ncbi:MAG TPA: acyl-CoA dehydratase activase [Armatimonadota bacterium]|nr:acyl-CoA dehydratase activase [Armatimonadota bacterium]
MERYLGIDVGSVTTKLVVINEDNQPIFTLYERTNGRPVNAIQQAFNNLAQTLGNDLNIRGVGTTGSGRQLASIMVGADEIRTEITAHATAAKECCPQVSTVIDIGGQDSKIIYIKQGVSTGFNMNTVCAAGTGSFLDHQATRLGIEIEEFGDYALRSTSPVKIAGRCGVFAESDLIHKQQMGYPPEDLIAGLCISLARNFLQNVARDPRGKKVLPTVLFQGGVAANVGMRSAFEHLIRQPLVVPEYFKVMGAWGAALLAKRRIQRTGVATQFRGVDRIATFDCHPGSFTCSDCSNNCEISELYIDDQLVSRWGSRCAKWENLSLSSEGRHDETEAPLGTVIA